MEIPRSSLFSTLNRAGSFLSGRAGHEVSVGGALGSRVWYQHLIEAGSKW